MVSLAPHADIALQFIFVGLVGASVIEARNGLGRDLWTLTPEQISSFLKIFWICSVLYTIALTLTKVSICFLYLRLFLDEKFRRIVWATQVFNFALLVSFIIVSTLQCRPISFYWTGWDGEHHGSCTNLNAAAWAHAAIHIALDIWMLSLPVPQIWRLNMSLERKAAILAMFGLGILYASPTPFFTPLRHNSIRNTNLVNRC